MKVLACGWVQMFCTAVVVCTVIGFALQILGVPSQQRIFPVYQDGFRFPTWSAGEQEMPSVAKTCQPKKHIMFLKTHKTASSTILNILHRFGDRHNLTFALPKSYQFSYPNLFHSRSVKGFSPARMQNYNIICHHMRFNLHEVNKVMPKDSFFFSILRNPITMAESSFMYYKDVAPAFKHVQSFEVFINNPLMYYNPSENSNHYARNLLFFDFGFNHNAQFNTTYASRAVAAVERTFQLILLMEYFDESLILLKEALCWELDDVVTFKLNFRSQDNVQALSPQAVEKLKEWNALDWYLYTHFNRTFWQKVEQLGWENMREEVFQLQKRQKELMEECLQGNRPVEANSIRDDNIRPFQFGIAKILGWVLKPDLNLLAKERCIRMVTPELQYKDLLNAKQFPPTNSSMTSGFGTKSLMNQTALLPRKDQGKSDGERQTRSSQVNQDSKEKSNKAVR
ncbi:galactose-3-O-sulfotransferase 4 isoform X2 [Microcaecilia unicolor]|uniref:Galactose-3-O-sulfotransferase 4 isoform X2 n=1 Tax=Microcaecilia unicolor TaxID=1415580 RepID=A0A6P7X0T2_9AMPH|nr:galactose-3-O-sulfotransferase 4 isoform X2 [Microcaecilia unicolor]